LFEESDDESEIDYDLLGGHLFEEESDLEEGHDIDEFLIELAQQPGISEFDVQNARTFFEDNFGCKDTDSGSEEDNVEKSLVSIMVPPPMVKMAS